MAASDDLSDLLVPHWSQDAPPSPGMIPPGQPASYGQGVLVEWDPVTFSNRVLFHGTVLENLPVMAGPDALAFRAGDVVGIQYWGPQGGSGQYWILPRIVVPGSGAAELAIASMRTDLGRAVARAVIGESFTADSSGGGQVTTRTWGDGSLGVGPVCQVDISELGLAVVWISAEFSTLTFEAVDNRGAGWAQMSVEITGATSRAPGFVNGVPEAVLGNQRGEVPMATGATVTSVQLVGGLNEGPHTFTCRYMCSFDVISWSAQDPTMVVLPF